MLQPSWNASSRQLSLCFLNSNLLEIDEARLVDVKLESTSVSTHLVATYCGLRELELLLDVLNYCLTIQTLECSTNEIRMHRMRAHHLPSHLY